MSLKTEIERTLTALNKGTAVKVSVETGAKYITATAFVQGITYKYNAHKGASLFTVLRGLKRFVKDDLQR